MTKVLLLIVSLAAWVYALGAGLPRADAQVQNELAVYLKAHYMPPEDYVIGKFKDHDVVFIGEWHRIKHDPLLIQALIPRLHKSGIYTLATEFARREDQSLIDHLINAPAYDEQLARQIQFNQFVAWGYQEYVDIYKAAWRLNRGLPKDSRKFRILGLGDSPDWSLIKTEEDNRNPAIRRQVWKGGGENLWARVILDDVEKKEKLLVYCGIHHAFSEYKQPVVGNDGKFVRLADDRMGNYVFRAIGKRAITIFLHSPWYPAEGYNAPYMVRPADGAIDAMIDALEPGLRRAGFDTRGTPFGQLPGGTSIYKHGYDGFKLADFCDGYIIQKPLSEYEGVTPIPDFVNEKNIEQARAQIPNPRLRTASIATFNRAIASDADMKKRFQIIR